MTILGLDPGYGRLGWGVIDDKKPKQTVTYGVIETPKSLDPGERLALLYTKIKRIIQRTHPDALALEKIFFTNNAKTAIAVAEARGVLLLLAAQQNLPVESLTPSEIKQTVTGYGKATKQQIQTMMQSLLKIKTPIRSDDAADALAAAYTAFLKHQTMKNRRVKKEHP